MSNLENTINDERVWEHLEELYKNDEAFCYKVCMSAEESAGCYDKDYYSEMCDEYLMSLHEAIMDSCEESTPNTIEETKEIAEGLLN